MGKLQRLVKKNSGALDERSESQRLLPFKKRSFQIQEVRSNPTNKLPEPAQGGTQEINQIQVIAGRLANYTSKWSSITTDKTILNYVSGYSIPFNKKPVQQLKPLQYTFSKSEIEFLEHELDRLKSIGAIEECMPCTEQFLSFSFLRPKPNGKFRFILNLKNLNRFITTEHFKLEDIRSAVNLLAKDDFLASLDLQDAYLLVPVRKQDRIYLRFEYKNKTWQFNCLPFGLAPAPYLFTKLMKPVVSKLRSLGYRSTIYLDDILIFGSSFKACQENVNQTVKLIKSLGFLINEDKSALEPCKICTFFGFVINSETMELSLTSKRKNKILSLIVELINDKKCTVSKLA